MNRRDLKRLKIDPSFVVTPDRFLSMFGIDCNQIKKISIHDLHYILGKNLHHAGVNQISIDRICKGEIILIGTPNNFKSYYRPIIHRIKINNTIEEPVMPTEISIADIKLEELCCLCNEAVTIEELSKYLDEIYERVHFNETDELESGRVKIYSLSSKSDNIYY